MRPEFNDYRSANLNTIGNIRYTSLLEPKAKVIIRVDDFKIAKEFFKYVTGKVIDDYTNYRHFTKIFRLSESRESIAKSKFIITNNDKVIDLATQLGGTLIVDFRNRDSLKVTVTHL